MHFKKFEISDIETLRGKISCKRSLSCENTVANLTVWAPYYAPKFYIDDENVYVKFYDKNGPLFSLPYCKNLPQAVEKVKQYCAEHDIPARFWLEDSEKFETFKELYGDEYFIYTARNSAEYIYLQSDLGTLSGKRYHSKRNHISAFSKKYEWVYEELSRENKNDFLSMAEEWYQANTDRMDESMQIEREGLLYLTENMESFGARGGLIRVGGKVVAITLGTPINGKIFDVNFEKALPDYSEAYTVINNEFARRLNYEFINREDDLGLAGLRRAKLSYHPHILLNKNICVPKQIYNSSKELHIATFKGETEQSADGLLGEFFENCFYKYKNGKIISQLFVIDGELRGDTVGYIYAAATDKENRGQGYMAELLEKAKKYYPKLALRPAEDSLYDYYGKFGFKTAFYNKKITQIRPCVAAGLEMVTDVNLFKEIRSKLLPQNSLNLCDKALRFVCENYCVITDKNEDKQFLAVFYKDGDTAHIKELLCSTQPDSFLATIMQEYGCTDFIAYTYCEDKAEKSGMLYPESDEINYLGIALD